MAEQLWVWMWALIFRKRVLVAISKDYLTLKMNWGKAFTKTFFNPFTCQHMKKKKKRIDLTFVLKCHPSWDVWKEWKWQNAFAKILWMYIKGVTPLTRQTVNGSCDKFPSVCQCYIVTVMDGTDSFNDRFIEVKRVPIWSPCWLINSHHRGSSWFHRTEHFKIEMLFISISPLWWHQITD